MRPLAYASAASSANVSDGCSWKSWVSRILVVSAGNRQKTAAPTTAGATGTRVAQQAVAQERVERDDQRSRAGR